VKSSGGALPNGHHLGSTSCTRRPTSREGNGPPEPLTSAVRAFPVKLTRGIHASDPTKLPRTPFQVSRWRGGRFAWAKSRAYGVHAVLLLHCEHRV
jgi:hypothetical protein